MSVLRLRDATGVVRPMHRAQEFGREDVPLPLPRWQAIAKAGELADAGMDFVAIAITMDHYHGWPMSSPGWWHAVRKWYGGPPINPARSASARAASLATAAKRAAAA